MKLMRVSCNQRANTVIALNNTVATMVFCRPTLSAKKPIKIRDTALTPLDKAVRRAPVSAEYPNEDANNEV
jgi:hypothetical protein